MKRARAVGTVFDRRSGKAHLFDASGRHGAFKVEGRTSDVNDPAILEALGGSAHRRLLEEDEMLDVAGASRSTSSACAKARSTDAAPALHGIATRGRRRWPVPLLLSAIARGDGMAQPTANPIMRLNGLTMRLTGRLTARMRLGFAAGTIPASRSPRWNGCATGRKRACSTGWCASTSKTSSALRVRSTAGCRGSSRRRSAPSSLAASRNEVFADSNATRAATRRYWRSPASARAFARPAPPRSW